MAQNLIDKNKKLFRFRSTASGAVLTKGKRTLYLTFMSVNQSNKAKDFVSKNSFDKMFKMGKKIQVFGPNNAYIDFRK